MVPDLLSSHGYETVGFCTNAQLDSLCEGRGAFDVYIPNPVRKNLHTVAGFTGLAKFLLNLQQHSGGYTHSIDHLNVGYLLNEGIRKRLDDATEPIFLYAHYKDPHFAYVPPVPYLRDYTADLEVSSSEAVEIVLDVRDNIYEHIANGCQFSDIQWSVINALYDACLAYTDERIGEIVSHIKSELDDVVIVITGDHGELLGELDLFGHRLATHDAASHVPLVIDGPTELVDYEGHIQHIDVIRVLLSEAGVAELEQGVDLRKEDRDWSVVHHYERRLEKQLAAIKEVDPDFEFERFHEGLLTSFRTDRFKYERSPGAEWLYELPDERTDVSSDHPDVVESFRETHRDFSRDIPRYDEAKRELSEERKKQLRDMGYLVD